MSCLRVILKAEVTYRLFDDFSDASQNLVFELQRIRYCLFPLHEERLQVAFVAGLV